MSDPSNPNSRETSDDVEPIDRHSDELDSMAEESDSEDAFDGEPESGQESTADTPDPHDYEDEDVADDFKAEHTSLKCFALIARHHGVDVSADRLIHDYSLENEEPNLRRLLRIAKDTASRLAKFV